MTKVAHTPGPWVARGREVEAAAPGVGSICTVGTSKDRALDLADAHLIAAAPDLYEALEKITDCYGVGMSREAFCAAVHDFMLEGRAALSRARGETS